MDNNILTFLSEYSIIIGNTTYPPVLFVWVLLFLLILFSIRMISWIINNKKNIDKNKILSFIIKQLPCYLCAVIISFSLTCIFANNTNKILNGFICPAIGYLGSIIFDIKFLSQSLKNSTPNNENNKTKKDENKQANNIIVKINHKLDEIHTDNIDIKSIDDYTKKPASEDYISDEDISSDDCNKIIKDKINDLVNSRYVEVVEIKKIYEEMKNQTTMLSAICETLKDEKKFELEKMIYECLNQGYATPEQNKVITSNYHNYRSLGGNGDIQELYDKHYLKLPIHDKKKYDSARI